MQDYETVVETVFFAYDFHEFHPHRRLYVRGVDDRRKGIGVDTAGKFRQFRHFLEDLAEVEGLEGVVGRVFLHSYGTARVDYKY